ncbi:MAG: hypothetical protein KDE14_15385 [Rhodobacteraceae bacterium]|nr:hypothetical protein [Paracoccaceae bacterium]
MLLPHITTDEHGHSLLGEVDLNMEPLGGFGGRDATYFRRIQAATQDVEYWRIGHALPGHFVDFAPTGASTFFAVFSGQMHMTVSNGESVQLARGDMMLAQDIAGQGHMTRFIGQEPCTYLMITMPGGFK